MKTKDQIQAAMRAKRIELTVLQEELKSLPKDEINDYKDKPLRGKALISFTEVMDRNSVVANISKAIPEIIDKHLSGLVDYAYDMEKYINDLATKAHVNLKNLEKYN